MSIRYPRRRITRWLVRTMGRCVIKTACRVQIVGRENFVAQGPLLVVGNHTAAMEAVLMVVFSPWPVEMLGSRDVPHELVTALADKVYGSIPVRRGHFDRSALLKALSVLRQGGILGLFPEGGIWAAGEMRARTGVAWLSARSGAPVLPIGFAVIEGALGTALRLKQPRMTMNVGKMIPAAKPSKGPARKADLEAFAGYVLERVRDLLPAGDREVDGEVLDERFALDVTVLGADGDPRSLPADPAIRHPAALGRLLHQPAILKILARNLGLPVGPLQNLASERNAGAIATAVRAILDHLCDENPYLLTYRFGPHEASAMEAGLREFLALAEWAVAHGCALIVTPTRRYRATGQSTVIVQTRQDAVEHWM